MRSRKLFIVSPGRSDLFASIQRVVAHERDVEVVYERRTPGNAVSCPQGDRRARPDLTRELQERGFAVVRVSVPAVERQRRIWAA